MNATLTEQVRSKFAFVARDVIQKEFSQLTVLGACCGGTSEGGSCCSTASGESVATPAAKLYPPEELEGVPSLAVSANSGCGNPVAVADPRPGETVLDLGSGSGVDAFLAARRVGPEGRVHGIDLTSEMVALANSAKRSAGISNVEFRAGEMEALPLADESVDVVVSNCSVNLSTDKPAVFREVLRVLKPGGRVAFCDIVASDALSAEERAARGSYVDCIAGALSLKEYGSGLRAAGLEEVRIAPIRPVADGMFAATVTGRKPAASAG
ncbi:MAG TPA: methyltransferase domain-containing protein [Actinomycetota bacterium]|nr:methyltransferase domain-containing protein [Actinomycetota bacterium]